MIWLLDAADQEPTPSPARAAIISVVIGDEYEAMWRQFCAASWRDYAERFGFDIIVYRDRLDKSDVARSPAWQKLLILSPPWVQRYERVVWLDSDVIITKEAPNILDYAGPPKKVGLSLDGSRLSPAEQHICLERMHKKTFPPNYDDALWRQSQINAYVADGLPPHEEMYNTGVMTLSPRWHNNLLLSVYGCPQNTPIFEQAHLSHLLLTTGLGYAISPRFNWGIMESRFLYLNEDLLGDQSQEALAGAVTALMRAEMRNAYFLHFYGARNLFKLFAGAPATQDAAAA